MSDLHHILKRFTTTTALSLTETRYNEFGRQQVRYFPATPPVNTAVQESQDLSCKVKFTQDAPVQYLHKTTITLLQNTIDWSPTSHPFGLMPSPSSQRSDAFIFLSNRWFSKAHHPTCVISQFLQQQRNISLFHSPPPSLGSFVLSLLCSCFDHERSAKGEEKTMRTTLWPPHRHSGAQLDEDLPWWKEEALPPLISPSIYFIASQSIVFSVTEAHAVSEREWKTLSPRNERKRGKVRKGFLGFGRARGVKDWMMLEGEGK